MTKITIGTKIYYRGDMANAEAFGEVTELLEDKWGSFFSAKMDDGREMNRVPMISLKDVDTGNGHTRFCTMTAYTERRATEMKAFNERMAKMRATA